MDIQLYFDPSVSKAPSGFTDAVNYVASYYDTAFTNSVTVAIDVGYGEVDGQSVGQNLGESISNYSSYNYSSLRSTLLAEATTPTQQQAYATLPASSPYNATLWLSLAQQRALGLISASGGGQSNPDGWVGFSNNLNFSYSPSSTPTGGAYYFVGVVEHEFSEIMGRTSFDSTGAINNAPSYTPMDLFRYTRSGGYATKWTLNPSYFSIDNGNTPLLYWNNGTIDRSGDLGDWANSGPNGATPTGPDAFLDETPADQVNGLSPTDFTLMNVLGWQQPNPGPPAGTTADLIMRDGSTGNYEICDIGNNAILAGYPLVRVGTEWQLAGLGGFNGHDTSDMALRDSNNGNFEIYDISNNNVSGTADLGQVGLEWQVAGFGAFNGAGGGTDMMMRNTNNGMFELYDISNNTVTGANAIGQVGLEWQVAGFGDFNGDGTADMMLRNTNNGMFELYDISNGAVTGANAIGQVGLEWQVAGFGDFDRDGTTDMMMRNTNNGMFELYDISNGVVTGANAVGQVGLEWQDPGFGPFNGAGTSDMALRNVNTGVFQVYDFANNQLTGASTLGQIGLEWQVGGFAIDPPTASLVHS